MKVLGKITLFDNVEAAFLAIGEGVFESTHLVIHDTVTQKVLHIENFVGLKAVLSTMNNEVSREPITPETIKAEIDDVFVFNSPLSSQNQASCERIQEACRTLAHAIAEEVPEGKDQTVAINNLLAAALWARHGITRRQVAVISASPVSLQEGSEVPSETTSPASQS